ncbi:hypothetical protein DSCOOX_14280 [Desulfosarcina ovata subsp. ovata]|uniref:Uncharacterized protein n=2 Tax=Desulfosarcina ovata TaxID=83564 RepID=A0A5K8A767_9BACT|nr:hypothetical protein DSCOOX_14280 [Desulfosarcina ovata subsp. ovata]
MLGSLLRCVPCPAHNQCFHSDGQLPQRVKLAFGAKYSFPEEELAMAIEEPLNNSQGVDIGLVTMFLKMSPEERLKANDNAVRTIQELRNAYKQKQNEN